MTEAESKIVEKLSEHGMVRTCKMVHPDVVTVVMTVGVSGNLMKSMELMTLITESFPEHPVLETYILEEGFLCLVLKKETIK